MPPAPIAPVHPRRPRLTLLILRIVVALTTLQIIAQPVLAGAYLQGEFDALGLHSMNASTLAAVLLVQIGAALAYWLFGKGSIVVVLLSVAMFFAVGLQIGMGFSRTLAVHIPLGVAIVALALGQLIWVFGRRASVGRRRRSAGLAGTGVAP
ncbi:MAG: hypothetical protein H0U22_11155 [Geodermatophilaceae bacterium]|nr:hypothetical protein [Geodermatophilaceae bacterium]